MHESTYLTKDQNLSMKTKRFRTFYRNILLKDERHFTESRREALCSDRSKCTCQQRSRKVFARVFTQFESFESLHPNALVSKRSQEVITSAGRKEINCMCSLLSEIEGANYLFHTHSLLFKNVFFSLSQRGFQVQPSHYFRINSTGKIYEILQEFFKL